MTILAEGTVPGVQDVVLRTHGDTFKTDVLNFTEIQVDRIALFNKIQTIQTINLFVVKHFGEPRRLRQFILKQNESATYLVAGEFLPLLAGDEIEAVTTTPDAVDITIYGTLK